MTSFNGLAQSSVATIDGLAISSVKAYNGLTLGTSAISALGTGAAYQATILPPLIPTMAWYDPSDPLYATQSGGNFVSLLDKTSHGYTLTASGSVQVGSISGLTAPKIVFGVFTSGVLAAQAQPFTIFMVLLLDDYTVNQVVLANAGNAWFIGSGGGGSFGGPGVYLPTGTGVISAYAGTVLASSTVPTVGLHLLTLVANGASSIIYWDGVAIATGDINNLNAFDGVNGTIILGSQTAAADWPITFSCIGEVQYHVGAMSVPNVALQRAWFTHKWGTP